MNEVKMGLVCFCLRGSNELNQQLLTSINDSGRLHMVPASINVDDYVIRFCVCAPGASDQDIVTAWEIITEMASDVIKKMEIETEEEREKMDVMKILETRSTQSLSYKRSFFVCMVSDPKLYNLKIMEKERKGEMLTRDPTSPMHSWVCWPLDCLMQVGTIKEVSMRFCTLDTTLPTSSRVSTSTLEISKSDDNDTVEKDSPSRKTRMICSGQYEMDSLQLPKEREAWCFFFCS